MPNRIDYLLSCEGDSIVVSGPKPIVFNGVIRPPENIVRRAVKYSASGDDCTVMISVFTPRREALGLPGERKWIDGRIFRDLDEARNG